MNSNQSSRKVLHLINYSKVRTIFNNFCFTSMQSIVKKDFSVHRCGVCEQVFFQLQVNCLMPDFKPKMTVFPFSHQNTNFSLFHLLTSKGQRVQNRSSVILGAICFQQMESKRYRQLPAVDFLVQTRSASLNFFHDSLAMVIPFFLLETLTNFQNTTSSTSKQELIYYFISVTLRITY